VALNPTHLGAATRSINPSRSQLAPTASPSWIGADSGGTRSSHTGGLSSTSWSTSKSSGEQGWPSAVASQCSPALIGLDLADD
jgi:hypothetical protein